MIRNCTVFSICPSFSCGYCTAGRVTEEVNIVALDVSNGALLESLLPQELNMTCLFICQLAQVVVLMVLCSFVQLVFGNSGVLQGIHASKAYVDMSTVDVETMADVFEV